MARLEINLGVRTADNTLVDIEDRDAKLVLQVSVKG